MANNDDNGGSGARNIAAAFRRESARRRAERGAPPKKSGGGTRSYYGENPETGYAQDYEGVKVIETGSGVKTVTALTEADKVAALQSAGFRVSGDKVIGVFSKDDKVGVVDSSKPHLEIMTRRVSDGEVEDEGMSQSELERLRQKSPVVIKKDEPEGEKVVLPRGVTLKNGELTSSPLGMSVAYVKEEYGEKKGVLIEEDFRGQRTSLEMTSREKIASAVVRTYKDPELFTKVVAGVPVTRGASEEVRVERKVDIPLKPKIGKGRGDSALLWPEYKVTEFRGDKSEVVYTTKERAGYVRMDGEKVYLTESEAIKKGIDPVVLKGDSRLDVTRLASRLSQPFAFRKTLADVRTSGVAPGFEPPKTLGGQVVWSAKNIFDFSKEGRAESKKYALGFAPEMMAGVASLPQRALEARSVTAASRVAGEGALLYLTGKSVERVAPVVARGYRRVFPEKVEVVRVGGESVGRTVGRKTVYEGGEFVETEAGRFMARADRGVYYGEVKAEVVGVELQSGEGVFGYVQKVDVLSDAGVKVAEVKGFGSGVLERGSSAGVGRQVVRVGEKAGEIFDVEFFGGVKSGKSAEFRVAGTEAEMLGGSFERYGMSVSKPLKGSSESVRFSRGKIDVTEDILLSDRQITLYRQSMLEYDFVQSKQSMRPSKPFLGGKKGQARAVSFETEIDAGFMSEINVGESGLKAGGEPFGKGLFTEDVFRSAVRGVLREQPLTRMTKLGSRSAGVALSGGVSGELVQSASVGKSAVESMFRAESFVGSSEGVIARADMMIDNGVVGEFDVASDVVSASDVRVQSEYLQAVGGAGSGLNVPGFDGSTPPPPPPGFPGLYPNVGFPERGASKSGFNSGIASFKYTPSFGGIVLGVKAPKKKPRIYSGFEIRGF